MSNIPDIPIVMEQFCSPEFNTFSDFEMTKCRQLRGASPPGPPDQGLCPWTPTNFFRLALRARHIASPPTAAPPYRLSLEYLCPPLPKFLRAPMVDAAINESNLTATKLSAIGSISGNFPPVLNRLIC